MSTLDTDVYATRQPGADADPQFIRRWSPRAMSGVALGEAEMLQLVEAARWSPSCFNSQPWRLVYALRGSEHWQGHLDLLMDMNQAWAHNAGALIAFVSKQSFEHNGQPAPTASFDTGSAWMALALQARHMGLVAHAMWGFHHDAAPAALGLTDDYRVEAMVAVGHPGEVDDLPEKYRERELPSPRKRLDEIAFAGRLPEA